MSRIATKAMAGMLALSMPAIAHTGYNGGGSRPVTTLEFVRVERVAELIRIRNRALQERAADGGTLSPQSRARLQRDIDLVEAHYHRQMARYDPFSVNADGSIVER